MRPEINRCPLLSNSIFLLLALLFAWNAAWAQPQPQQQTSGPPKLSSRPPQDPNASRPTPYPDLASIHVQSTLVQAPVTVMDPSGQFIENLSESDFRILDNGVPQRISKFGLAMQPVALVILVQTNKAVGPLLNQVRPLGSLFSGLLLGKPGQAALITFDDTVRVDQDFTGDPNALAQALQHITTGGTKARLNDALGRAILMLANRPTQERRVVIVFSEGNDNGSETTRGEIIRAATGAGVAIYGLRFSPVQALLHNQQEPPPPNTLARNMALPGPPGRPQTPNNVAVYNQNSDISVIPLASGASQAIRSLHGKDLMEIYAGYTGGVTYSHWKTNELQKQLTRIALEINSQYMLAYTPSTLNEPGFHRLQIEVVEPNLRVRSREGYFYGMGSR
jgi:VWFA-related protein